MAGFEPRVGEACERYGFHRTTFYYVIRDAIGCRSRVEGLMRRQKRDVFLSYASEDQDLMLKLGRAFFEQGIIAIWVDIFSIAPGDSIPSMVDDGISRSKFLIPIVTSTYFRKPWTKLELAAVRMAQKPIIPVWIGVDYKAVSEFSSILAQHKAVLYAGDPHLVAGQISDVLLRDRSTMFYKNRQVREDNKVFWQIARVYVLKILGDRSSKAEWNSINNGGTITESMSVRDLVLRTLCMTDSDISERKNYSE